MRFRITVRGDHAEVRGYLDTSDDAVGEGHPELVAFAEAMKPFGIVVASPAEDTYNPFGLQREGGSLGGF